MWLWVGWAHYASQLKPITHRGSHLMTPLLCNAKPHANCTPPTISMTKWWYAIGTGTHGTQAS